MLIECPKCHLSSDININKIPSGTTHVICPECHWKFKFVLAQPRQFSYEPDQTPIEYKFIKTKTDALYESSKNYYQMIIVREARDGWELVQAFAPPLGGYGKASWCDLIFKRRRENRPAAS